MDSSPLLPPAPPPSPQEFAAGKPPATIVQANKWTFKELVQRFTGQAAAADGAATPRRGSAVPRSRSRTAVRKRVGFKLARRYRPKTAAVTPVRQLNYPFSGGTVDDSPSLASSLSTAGACVLNKAADLPSPASASTMAEEVVRGEADKGGGEPKLLALFPVTSSYPEESSKLEDM